MQDQHPQTLTEMRATAVLDTFILDDFGDGSPSESSRAWETDLETTRTQDRDTDSEKARRGIIDNIPLHDIQVESRGVETGRDVT